MGEERRVYKVLVENSEGKRPLERPRSRWEDWIKWSLGRFAGRVQSGFPWLRIGTVTSCCEHSDEPFGVGATELVQNP
jgi:hypothetical protein